MKIKDGTVECQFHWHLINFLLTKVDPYYRQIGGELIITSGSEARTRHGYTSLHYADPCCAADIRSWDVVGRESVITDAQHQAQELSLLARDYEQHHGLTPNTLEVILESNHIHLEFQPKRR